MGLRASRPRGPRRRSSGLTRSTSFATNPRPRPTRKPPSTRPFLHVQLEFLPGLAFPGALVGERDRSLAGVSCRESPRVDSAPARNPCGWRGVMIDQRAEGTAFGLELPTEARRGILGEAYFQ